MQNLPQALLRALAEETKLEKEKSQLAKKKLQLLRRLQELNKIESQLSEAKKYYDPYVFSRQSTSDFSVSTSTLLQHYACREVLQIKGGARLAGKITVEGSKNSSLVLMAACLLTNEKVILRNVPQLIDVISMNEILEHLGVECSRSDNTLELLAENLIQEGPSSELVDNLRASFFCIGPLISRLGTARVPLPSSGEIGVRPVLEHVRGLRAIGAHVSIEENVVIAKAPGPRGRLSGGHISLRCPSVGATETLMMASVLSTGETVIENAALEPEVVDLAGLLSDMGAKISGAGTSSITIHGVERLGGAEYTVVPDRIEAGTFLVAGAITRSNITVGPVILDHLTAVVERLKMAGCTFDYEDDCIQIHAEHITAVDITTEPFPGFPTDLQPQFMSLLSTAQGVSRVVENIFENRLKHVQELQKMGALIQTSGHIAAVQGVQRLVGTHVRGNDLRASAGLVLAGLAAEGTTTVRGLEYLDRGYLNFDSKLADAGAEIRREQMIPAESAPFPPFVVKRNYSL
jgi:UDP-N-acetylglucosamine 1-carboxyvinyltransferase